MIRIFAKALAYHFQLREKDTSSPNNLTLLRMGLFGAAHGWGGKKTPPHLPKIYRAYPTIMKLGTLIFYL